jgi:uncharacterized protein YkwD
MSIEMCCRRFAGIALVSGDVREPDAPTQYFQAIAARRIVQSRPDRGDCRGFGVEGSMIRVITGMLLALLCGAAAAQADSYSGVVSQYRKAHGLSAVRYDAGLTRVAQHKAWSMANGGGFDHNAGEFAGRVSSVSSHAAENIAYGHSTFARTMEQWKASAAHRRNLLMRGATRVGVGSASNGKQTYWSLVIGK